MSLSVSDVAKRIGLSTKVTKSLVRAGHFPSARKYNGAWRINVSDVHAFLRKDPCEWEGGQPNDATQPNTGRDQDG